MPPVSSGGGFTENLDFELSEFSTMSESKIEEEFQQVSYIASEYETELFNNCATHEAKQRFLFGFWKRRNPDTTKAVNEARENYRKQIAVSNKKFAYAKMKDGWRTDRGRILLKYGEPTTIEYHVQEGEKKAYEIWYYDSLMGGVQFIFADWKRNGFYILVHSNMPNETRNDNWYKDYILK
jgi:GWxTD domain-containing protein